MPSLTAQLPLLDGAEGKSDGTVRRDKIRALEPDSPGKDVRDSLGFPAEMTDAPPMASTQEREGGSRSPILIGIGAVSHVSQPEGLQPPRLEATSARVTGADTPHHRIENKRRRKALLASQLPATQWTTYKGEFELPPPLAPLESHWGEICPAGLALHHPAAELLKEWASYGCPTCTGRPWAPTEMQEAVDHGPHCSAMSDDAIVHFEAEVAEKVKSGQAKLVAWMSIKDNPPTELKISPIAAIPHKSKQF